MTAMYEMYSDESENGDYITVAGYLYTKKHRQKLKKEWDLILNKYELPYFHMIECAHGNGSFNRWKKDSNKRVKIQTQLFKVLKKHKSVGFAVSFDKRLSYLLPSSSNIGIDQINPYSFCAYWIMVHARNWADKRLPNSKIDYFYEAGHKDESEARKIMHSLSNDDWHKKHFKIASYSFVEKIHSAAIQTSDVLAWQWCKYRKDQSTNKRKPREDLKFLIDDQQTYCIDFDKEKILEFIEIINRPHPQSAS